MKVYIGVDMEGVSGVLDMAHTNPAGSDYEPARRWLVGETNAAVEGALAAGATEIWVSDSHGGNSAHNMLMNEIHPQAMLLSGMPKPSALDDSFDALIQVGQHVMNGQPGVISHTINSRVVNEMRINGRPFGEVALLSAVAGDFGIPTVLVTGDDKTGEEAKSFMPWVETVPVKWALTRNSARCLPHSTACDRIREGAEKALRNLAQAEVFTVEGPVEIEMEFKDAGMADGASGMPGTTRINGATVGFTAPDMVAAKKAIMAMIGQASATVR